MAREGNAVAQYSLGVMCEEGRGLAQDHKEAVSWYRLAAEQAYAPAQFNLGVMYHDGRGVRRTTRRPCDGSVWRRTGVAPAQFGLGLLL